MFARFSNKVAELTGRPVSFFLSCTLVVVWLASGPIFGYSDTWQLIINTATTVLTFLMVFVIQSSQNVNTDALHKKLDELIRSNKDAKNDLIGIEKRID